MLQSNSQSPQLTGRHLFITGGTGFIGKSVLDYLLYLHDVLKQSFQVTVLSRSPEVFLQKYPRYAQLPWLYFVKGSLAQLPNASVPYTDVIHAAADTHSNESGALWVQQIINGTHNVLEFAVRSGAKRFLLTSSGAIYGAQPDGLERITEDYTGAPNTCLMSSTYGQAKRVAEQLCTIYQQEHELETICARCFAFAGEHLPLNGAYAIGNFINDALYGDAIRVKGDGTAVRSYLDGEDMARWLIHLLCEGKAGESYNVGSDQAVTIAELARVVASVVAPSKKVTIEQAVTESNYRSRYVPAIEKVGRLGLHPTYDLVEIIQRTVAALGNQNEKK